MPPQNTHHHYLQRNQSSQNLRKTSPYKAKVVNIHSYMYMETLDKFINDNYVHTFSTKINTFMYKLHVNTCMLTCIYGTYNDYLISQRTYLNEIEILISVPVLMQNWPFSGILNIV